MSEETKNEELEQTPIVEDVVQQPTIEMTKEEAIMHDFQAERNVSEEMKRISETETQKKIQEYLDSVQLTVRGIRQTIDTHINSTPMLGSSREISLCHTNLQRAKAFLGLTLGELGSANPYPKSSDSLNPIIEKQAEHSEEVLLFPGELDNIGRIKYMRSTIAKIFEELEVLLSNKRGLPTRAGFWAQESLVATVEAKMWLGWALDAIRKQNI